jgi:predicted MFS family arabinose efflux permease
MQTTAEKPAETGFLSPARLGGSRGEAVATGLGLTSTLGVLGLVPLLIGGYVEGYHLSLREASELVSIEVAAAIVTLLGIASRMSAASRQRVSRAGAVIGGASYLIGAALSGFWPLVIFRVISGIGIGLIGAAVNASVARARAPERLYATGLTMYGALETVKLFVLPQIYGRFGYWTLFAGISALFLITAGTSSGLNDTVAAETKAAPGAVKGAASWILAPRVAAMLLGYFLMWIAFSMIWAFAERKATSIGMSAGAIGSTLAASNIVGLLGSVLANRLGTRMGRSLPIVAGSMVLAISFYLTGAGREPQIFVTSIIAYGVAYFFLLPYVLGLAVQLDRQGRVSVINSMMPWVAHLVSPLLGAAVLAYGSFSTMGAASAGTMLLAASFVVAAGSQPRTRPETARVSAT